jgi:hypothetical protein
MSFSPGELVKVRKTHLDTILPKDRFEGVGVIAYSSSPFFLIKADGREYVLFAHQLRRAAPLEAYAYLLRNMLVSDKQND